jgi:hypothetical protein
MSILLLPAKALIFNKVIMMIMVIITRWPVLVLNPGAAPAAGSLRRR